MAVDYSSWSVDKLNKEKTKIEKAIDAKESQNRKAAIAELKAVAKKAGINLSELVSGVSSGNGKAATGKKRGRPAGKKRAGTNGKAKPKYANPADPEQTWTGRGRKPHWVLSHLDNGGNVEDLAIQR